MNAPTRKAVSEVSKDAYARYLKGEAAAVPAWMQVKEGDSDKQREKKQRALKALKKRMRRAPPPPRGTCMGWVVPRACFRLLGGRERARLEGAQRGGIGPCVGGVL